MTCSSQGSIARLSINGYQMPFKLIDDQSVRELVDDNDEVSTGLMDPVSTRVSLGQQILTLNIRLNPTPLELTQLLPLMGGTLSTGTWTLDETVTSFPVVIDRVAKVHTYSTCYVNAWRLYGQKGRAPIGLDLQIFGSTYSEGTSFGSPTALQTDAPYPFTGVTLTLRGSTRVHDRFALSVNHFLYREFENALTANCIDMTRRRATLALSAPYVSSNTALLNTPFATDADGAAATLAIVRGNQSTTFSFTNVKEIARPPGVPAHMAIRLPLYYRIYRTIAAKAFSAAHDDTV